MSEHAPSPETNDPHFDEAVRHISVNVTRILEHYRDFAVGEQNLGLAVYVKDKTGAYEPAEHQRLNIHQEIDLTDAPGTTETIVYHIWIESQAHNTIAVDAVVTKDMRDDQAIAEVKKGSIHVIDNALQNFIEAKGL